jgi:6-phosphogluconolactonase
MSLRIDRVSNPGEAADRAFACLEAAADAGLRERGRFVIALAGGSTPREAYRLWGQRSRIDWPRGVLIFGDERCVPPDHPESNYRMVQESLLSQLARQPRVLRIQGEDHPPERAAELYDAELHRALAPDERLDLAFLGIGEDGHTASLFPGQAALDEARRWCVATTRPEANAPPVQRLTLTLPLLQGARRIVLLACGTGKAAILAEALQGPLHPRRLPAQFFLREDRLPVILIVDAAAAVRLQPQ